MALSGLGGQSGSCPCAKEVLLNEMAHDAFIAAPQTSPIKWGDGHWLWVALQSLELVLGLIVWTRRPSKSLPSSCCYKLYGAHSRLARLHCYESLRGTIMKAIPTSRTLQRREPAPCLQAAKRPECTSPLRLSIKEHQNETATVWQRGYALS